LHKDRLPPPPPKFSLNSPQNTHSAAPWALSAQESLPDFSSIDSNLERLETLITDTLNSSETLTQQLADLDQILNEKEQSLYEREQLLTKLRTQFNEMSETYKTLSASYAKSEANSRFWEPEPRLEAEVPLPPDFYNNRDTNGGSD
jgi:septal ring factor EnvC (AmiA/AmiB activator)